MSAGYAWRARSAMLEKQTARHALPLPAAPLYATPRLRACGRSVPTHLTALHAPFLPFSAATFRALPLRAGGRFWRELARWRQIAATKSHPAATCFVASPSRSYASS